MKSCLQGVDRVGFCGNICESDEGMSQVSTSKERIMPVYTISAVLCAQVMEEIEADSEEAALEKFHNMPENELNADWEDPWVASEAYEVQIIDVEQ